MPTFKVGERIRHPDHGEGTVTFVGADYVGVEFDGKRDALLRLDSFTPASPDVIPETAPAAYEKLGLTPLLPEELSALRQVTLRRKLPFEPIGSAR